MPVITADCLPDSTSDQVVFSFHARSVRELGCLFPQITGHGIRQTAAPAVRAIHARQGTSYTRSGIASAFSRAGEKAGVRGANAKVLRPFAAKAQGDSMQSIQDALSHVDISTTQGYIHSMVRRTMTVEPEIPAEG